MQIFLKNLIFMQFGEAAFNMLSFIAVKNKLQL